VRFAFLLTILFSFSASAGSCFIETYDQILILSKQGDFSNLVKKSNCNNEQLGRFIVFAQNAQGPVQSFVFSNTFKDISITPQKVVFRTLDDELSRRGILPTEGKILEAKRLSGLSALTFAKDQKLDLDCASCPSTGENTIRIRIRDSLGSSQSTHWITTEIGVPTKALVATRSHAPGLNAIDPSGFVQKNIYSSKPNQLLSAAIPLHFYKLSKTIAPGETLFKSQVSPMQLVRPDTDVNVLIQDGAITINGSAKPLSYGVLGQRIKLKNSRSSRIIWGKVVDTNKVVVEL
tara:strand:+ start:18045 stop:18917 length:873 start_codon:yes stop_codon:yes gene_type:complete